MGLDSPDKYRQRDIEIRDRQVDRQIDREIFTLRVARAIKNIYGERVLRKLDLNFR